MSTEVLASEFLQEEVGYPAVGTQPLDPGGYAELDRRVKARYGAEKSSVDSPALVVLVADLVL